MKAETECVFAEDPPAVVLGELEVTTLGPELCRALQPALQNRSPRFRRRAQTCDGSGGAPPFTCESGELHHGRKERRVHRIYQTEPLRVGLPHIRTLVVREKTAPREQDLPWPSLFHFGIDAQGKGYKGAGQ